MLRGEAQYALDDKGRVVIPPKFRAAMGERIIVTRWTDPCLFAFSAAEWASLEQKLSTLPLLQHEARRYVLSGAEDCDLDRQGRIFLAPHLREHAGITRSVTIIGAGGHLELWSSAEWRRRLQRVRRAPAELAQQLQALTL
jgi:MraZ protein